MTPHIEASPGDYADLVLMPGDPLRAKYIAENFFERPRRINSIRNCFGYSGFYKGRKVSVQASGMGQPSLGIYATELYKFYGVENIIRIGTCGAFNAKVSLGDIILAESACSNSNIGGHEPGVFVKADENLVSTMKRALPKDITLVGRLLSADCFYVDTQNWWHAYAEKEVLGVDMESHYLYCLASKYGTKAVTVNLVVDNLESQEAMHAFDRVTRIDTIVTRTLEAMLLQSE